MYQNASIKLLSALDDDVPLSARHFYNLAALEIRRVLLDLARHYQRRLGTEAIPPSDTTANIIGMLPDRSEEPSSLAEWAEFHSIVDGLPKKIREVFGLRWYDGLELEEIAEVLGVSVRTVKRRWVVARLDLERAFGKPPHH